MEGQLNQHPKGRRRERRHKPQEFVRHFRPPIALLDVLVQKQFDP